MTFSESCDAGFTLTEEGCVQCPADSYVYDWAGVDVCGTCPEGKMSAAGSAGEDKCYYGKYLCSNWSPIYRAYRSRKFREALYKGVVDIFNSVNINLKLRKASVGCHAIMCKNRVIIKNTNPQPPVMLDRE